MESLIALLPFGLIALVCPLAMLVMMRGMMGGHGKHEDPATSNTEPDQATATRLAAMEHEITRLRGELDAASRLEAVGQGRNGGRR